MVLGMQAVGEGKDISSLTLGHLLDLDLPAFASVIDDVASVASKEAIIERKLARIAAEWSEETLNFHDFKNRGNILLSGSDVSNILERLASTQVTLGQLLAEVTKSQPFFAELAQWVGRLAEVEASLELWFAVQTVYVRLKGLFDDIDGSRQLALEGKRFAKVEKNYLKNVRKAYQTRKILDICCGSDGLYVVLPSLREQFENIDKSLSTYLDTKRLTFPRYFFLSNGDLLNVVSQSASPSAVKPYLSMLFPGVHALAFDRVDSSRVRQIVSLDGETVDLLFFPEAKSGGAWLGELQASIKNTIKSLIRLASMDFNSSLFDSTNRKYPMQVHMICVYLFSCAKVSLLGVRLRWTEDCERALVQFRTDKNAMSNLLKKTTSNLQMAVDKAAAFESLDKLERIKTETFVVVLIEQRSSLCLEVPLTWSGMEFKSLSSERCATSQISIGLDSLDSTTQLTPTIVRADGVMGPSNTRTSTSAPAPALLSPQILPDPFSLRWMLCMGFLWPPSQALLQAERQRYYAKLRVPLHVLLFQ